LVCFIAAKLLIFDEISLKCILFNINSCFTAWSLSARQSSHLHRHRRECAAPGCGALQAGNHRRCGWYHYLV